MTLYNVRQISMDLVQQVLQGTNPYIEGPSLIWIISFYCLIFFEKKTSRNFYLPSKNTNCLYFIIEKKDPWLLYRAILNGPI